MRHQIFTTLFLLLGWQATFTQALTGQDLDDVLFTVGTTLTDSDSDGHASIYLLWQTEDLQQLKDREFAIYSKPGEADSTDPYTFEGTARLRLDPAAINVLLQRGEELLDDPVKLESDITTLFEELVPDGDISLAERISAVVEGCLLDPELFENLIFLSRTHPTLSLVIGTGFTSSYPDGEIYTWEIRECPPESISVDECDQVLARITLRVGDYRPLPAPGQPVCVRFSDDSGNPDPRAHLNIPLRWSTPDELRLRTLLQFGYNLYRMSAEEALAVGFDSSPPTPDMLVDLALDPGHSTTRVNSVPILTDRILTDTEALNTVTDPKTYFIIDDNGRYQPDGLPFANGDEYFYFVTARDILGRDGEVSAGTSVLICDFMPPPQPQKVKVANDYTFNPATDINRQYFKINWEAPDLSSAQTPETITGYQVYRWWTIEEMQQRDTFPYIDATTTKGGLVAMLPPSQTEFIDNGATAPYLEVERLPDGSTSVQQNYANKTFWYTVRAVDGSACGNGNLSGNSAPAFGVLRDRIGPPKPTGLIRLNCLDIQVSAPQEVQPGTPWDNPPELGIAYLRLEGKALDTFVQWVEFAIYDPQTGENTLLDGRTYFTKTADSHILQLKLPKPTEKDPLYLACRMGGRNGKVSSWNILSIPAISNEYAAFNILWEGRSQIIRTIEGDGCETHISLNPDFTLNWVVLEFDLTVGTEEWKVYRRVNEGQLTMIAQGLDSALDAIIAIVEDRNMPARDARVCYFVQLFDQHGNPSPIVRLGCIEIQGKEELPTPMQATPIALGTEAAPEAILSWFCPPYGVEYFEVWVSSLSGDLPTSLGDDFDPPGADSTVDGIVWRPFRSKRVAVTFPANTPEFSSQIDGIALGEVYTFRIRAIGDAGGEGAFSNDETLIWSPDTASVVSGPNVPWPALGLPRVALAFNEGIFATVLDKANFDGAVVRIAEIDYMEITNPSNPEIPTDFFYPPRYENPNDLVYKNKSGDSLFPFVLYRYQLANDNYPIVSGDVYQVSPMMESMAFQLETTNYGFEAFQNYDPFVLLVGDEIKGSTWYDLMFKDTQPVTSGARYRYLIVRFDPLNKEIVEVIPTNAVDIP